MPYPTLNEHFEIINEIGRGATGAVYLGRDNRLDRLVAIKVFNSLLSSRELLRAQREAKALARIKHANLVGIHSVERDKAGRLALVVDFIDGMPLSELMSKEPLSCKLAFDLFNQLCNGLSAIHGAGIVHRDIKPSNLMVQSTVSGQRLWIIDFGLAKFDDGVAQDVTATGMIVGTPAYMSPEQFRSSRIGPPSDLYSAAIVLYEMLTGNQPFASDSPYSVAHKQLSQAPPSVSSTQRTIPNSQAIDSCFAKALHKDPHQRFQSAQEMLHSFNLASESGVQVVSAKVTDAPSLPKDKLLKAGGVLVLVIAGLAAVLNAQLFMQSPKSATGLLAEIRQQGEIYYHAQDYAAARNYYEEVIPRLEKEIARQPDSSTYPLEMARVYMAYSKCCARTQSPEDVEKGIAATNKALELRKEQKTQRTECCKRLAHLFGLAGQYALALNAYNSALQSEGSNSEEQLNTDERGDLCWLLKNAGLAADAITRLNRWMPPEADPDSMGEVNKKYKRSLGGAYMNVGMYKEAVPEFERAYRIPDSPDKNEDALELAYCNAMLGNVKESQRWLVPAKSAIGNGPRDAATYRLVEAANAWTANDLTRSRELLREVLLETESLMETSGSAYTRRTALHKAFEVCQLAKAVALKTNDPDSAKQFERLARQALPELIKEGVFTTRSRAS